MGWWKYPIFGLATENRPSKTFSKSLANALYLLPTNKAIRQIGSFSSTDGRVYNIKSTSDLDKKKIEKYIKHCQGKGRKVQMTFRGKNGKVESLTIWSKGTRWRCAQQRRECERWVFSLPCPSSHLTSGRFPEIVLLSTGYNNDNDDDSDDSNGNDEDDND